MKHKRNVPINQNFPHSLVKEGRKEGRKAERKETRKKHSALQQLTGI